MTKLSVQYYRNFNSMYQYTVYRIFSSYEYTVPISYIFMNIYRSDLFGIGVVSGHGIKVPWTPAFYVASLVLSLVAARCENVLIHPSVSQGKSLSEGDVSS